MSAEFIGTTGRRRDSRLRVAIPAQLILLGGQARAQLRDLSQSGARFWLGAEIDLGREGVLTWLEFEAFGRFVWQRNSFGAMEFDEPLAVEVLIKTREKLDHKQIRTEKQVTYQKSRDWFLGNSRGV